MLNTPVKMSLFGSLDVFGFYYVRFLAHVRVLSCSVSDRKVAAPRLTESSISVMLGFLPCSVCSVDFVENLCKSLRKTLWRKRGKSFLILWKSEFCTIWWKIIHAFRTICGKFYYWFCTRIFPCKSEVLHIFHRDYYYDY